jgi:hypothetical protein
VPELAAFSATQWQVDKWRVAMAGGDQRGQI